MLRFVDETSEKYKKIYKASQMSTYVSSVYDNDNNTWKKYLYILGVEKL